MDWIDEKLYKLKNKLKMQSLKRSLSIYLIIAIFVVIICYFVTIIFCNGWKVLIYQKYSLNIYGDIPINYLSDVDSADIVFMAVIEIVERFSVLLYSIIAIIITSHIFYKNKIEEPVLILKEEANYISRNDLSFSCVYKSGDEMGEICESFEKMRLQLLKNKENLWSIMESQRQLNSAFAHDLRTPLTVIQGYADFLSKYYKTGKISEEKLMNTIELIQSQVYRLKDFSETMKNIHTFDSMEVNRKKNNIEVLNTSIGEIIEGLKVNYNLKINVNSKLPNTIGYFDKAIVLQVVDNLLSNALSYAVSSIDIILEIEGDFLLVYVKDDGVGFSSKDLYSASKPYYSNRKNTGEHFGIGLTICKLLCEKHDGNLRFNNSTKGGAIVCATFCIV